ncbi:GDP-mannose 4,6-dehydratase [Verrucomicrobiota bacterium sgz303538]
MSSFRDSDPTQGMPVALITGITGQDGSYLTELLLEKGYVVHGIVRRASIFNRSRIEHLREDPAVYGKFLFLHYADLHDPTTLRRLIGKLRPNELYHLAGQSHVGLSFEIPESTCDEVARGTLTLLEICRDQDYPVRFYHASSSEVFGRPDDGRVPQTESTPFRPQSPYGCAKAFATDLCRVYREAYGLFACSGLTYNHESPRRGENFVTRKITAAAARIKAGLQDCLWLGNLSARRDWGYAREYVQAMWLMLQQKKPADYVLATGVAYSVRDFVAAAFESLDISLEFTGTGENENGVEKDSGRTLVQVDPRFFRPADPERLIGDPCSAAQNLGWEAKTTAPALAALMAKADAKVIQTQTAAT